MESLNAYMTAFPNFIWDNILASFPKRFCTARFVSSDKFISLNRSILRRKNVLRPKVTNHHRHCSLSRRRRPNLSWAIIPSIS